MVSDASAKETYILGVGDFLMGSAEVMEIRRDRVILKRNGHLEFIKLEDTLSGNPSMRTLTSGLSPAVTDLRRTPPPKPKGSSDDDEPAKKSGSGSGSASSHGGVKKVGPTAYELDRDALNRQLNDRKALADQAKILPNYDKSGKKHGIKLIGVASSGVYGKIGIRSGDVITKINGRTVRSQNQALELLDGLRNKNHVTVEIERRGASKTFDYKVK